MKKMKVFKSLLIGFALFVSAGCNVRLVDKGGGAQGEQGAAPLNQIEAVSTGEWNHYVLRIPSQLVQGPVMRQQIGRDLAQRPKVLKGSGPQLYDEDVIGGEIYEYSFFSNDDSKEPQKVRVAVPLDLVIDQNLDLNDPVRGQQFLKIERFGHLIFKNIVLKTSGRNLNLIADDIDFDNTMIKSFDPGAVATIGHDGSSGGIIKIRAARATGLVNFELRGQNGGEGSPGLKPDAKIKGHDGQKGVDAGSYYSSLSGTYHCTSFAQAGTAGEAGQRGYQGLMGGRGGDSGEVLLMISDRGSLQIAPLLEAGIGGRGGRGGEGGEGGNGGVGMGGPANECSQGQAAPNGLRGPQGADGPEGFAGAIKRVCFIDPGKNPSCL